ncbi:MAG: phytanoyl-CoA dioxygenase family protein [Oceanicaulis sp.]
MLSDERASLKASYAREGYVSPLTVLSAAECETLRSKMNALGEARGGLLPPGLNMKAHLLVPALWRLVQDPRVIEPVAAILGEDVLCWGSSFFDKRPGDAGHAPWHQDSTYWGLERPDALTAWVALTHSTPENGCLRVIPGSHSVQIAHKHAHDPDNMLLGGEVICANVDEAKAVDLALKPGEMSIHHQQLIHGSRRNRSTERRFGFAIRYIAGHLRSAGGAGYARSYATLVRGKDHGGFILETAPERDLDRDALRRHGRILRATYNVVNARISAHEAARGVGDHQS